MQVIKPSVGIVDMRDGLEIIEKIERAGRVSYKSEDKISPGTAKKFIAMLISKDHLSVLEHENVTVKFVCDRGVSHELVRHRIASFTQESTRYCNYSQDKFGEEITVIGPMWWCTDINDSDDDVLCRAWYEGCEAAEAAYFTLLRNSASPQQARSVLPNSLKTEVVMTANLREWRHFFGLRTSGAAHPQMREVAIPLLLMFQDRLPEVYGDIQPVFNGLPDHFGDQMEKLEAELRANPVHHIGGRQ